MLDLQILHRNQEPPVLVAMFDMLKCSFQNIQVDPMEIS